MPPGPQQLRDRARATERRRALQPLFNGLDAHLAPLLDRGVLLAISGGRDSAVLLEVIARWPSRPDLGVQVASVDHGHRAQARLEAERVVDRAWVLGFEADVVVGGGRGEAGHRLARYRALAAHARQRGLGVLVTAHHADDDAEGLLLDLLGQGGGRGGAAMAPVAPLPAADGAEQCLVRPLLGLHRSDIELAATALGLRHRFIDERDRRGVGARARLRRQLVPSLSALLGADAGPRLARVARRRAVDEGALRDLAGERVEVEVVGSGLRLAATHAPAALWRRALVESIQRLGVEDARASAATLDALAARAAAGGQGRFDLAGVRAELKPGVIMLHLTP
jgi:tRNA(Ile)-lysidine synthase